MAHGQQKLFIVCVSQDGRIYDRVYTTTKEKNAESYLSDYVKEHPEVVRAFIDKQFHYKNDKRKDWEE